MIDGTPARTWTSQDRFQGDRMTESLKLIGILAGITLAVLGRAWYRHRQAGEAADNLLRQVLQEKDGR
jgi:hypothetical protein